MRWVRLRRAFIVKVEGWLCDGGLDGWALLTWAQRKIWVQRKRSKP